MLESACAFCWNQTPTSAPHLSLCLSRSCYGGWGRSSPVLPGSHRLEVSREAVDWHPDCQLDDGSYQENQKWHGEVRLPEWPPVNLRKRGRCGQLLPSECVRLCASVHAGVFQDSDKLYACVSIGVCILMSLSVGGYSGTCLFFYPSFF